MCKDVLEPDDHLELDDELELDFSELSLKYAIEYHFAPFMPDLEYAKCR